MKERGEAMASSFEHYCRERWQFARAQAYRLIDSAKVIENLSTTVDISERHIRPLTKLEPEQQGREKGRGVAEGHGEGERWATVPVYWSHTETSRAYPIRHWHQ